MRCDPDLPFSAVVLGAFEPVAKDARARALAQTVNIALLGARPRQLLGPIYPWSEMGSVSMMKTMRKSPGPDESLVRRRNIVSSILSKSAAPILSPIRFQASRRVRLVAFEETMAAITSCGARSLWKNGSPGRSPLKGRPRRRCQKLTSSTHASDVS